jgi:benzoyl-CoA reductase subunit A
MKCVVGIDLGSTTTKAVILDEEGNVLGRGITNSRSSYEAACAVAREEALTSARFTLLRRGAERLPGAAGDVARWMEPLQAALKLELYLDELADLRATIFGNLQRSLHHRDLKPALEAAAHVVLDDVERDAPKIFLEGDRKRSDFFRDIAGASFMAGAERLARDGEVPFEPFVALYDRAILDVETRVRPRDTVALLRRASHRLAGLHLPEAEARDAIVGELLRGPAGAPLEEVAFSGTGYGRQTLPFPKSCVRSEILCHGRGAHRVFPSTRTVLDIGGQDTKAIQVDERGVVTSFQMNDRCAAGCGRYLGYIADELSLGLHELGPLALEAKKCVKVSSTCTVFAGAELRERLALGQRREDVLAGLHRAIMLRAMSILARSGGVRDQFTFTGGVCNNPMATKVLRELVDENYSKDVTLNIHPDSIYMGALGAALFALDDVRAGVPAILPTFAAQPSAGAA